MRLSQLLLVFSLLGLVECPAYSQVTAEQTGVQTEALQHTFDDHMSFAYTHGQLCQKTLKQVVSGLQGIPANMDYDLNFAGILTSRWSQQVSKPDGRPPVVWKFECVSQIRAGKRLAILSLVMYQEQAGERRGGELLTQRDVRVGYVQK